MERDDIYCCVRKLIELLLIPDEHIPSAFERILATIQDVDLSGR